MKEKTRGNRQKHLCNLWARSGYGNVKRCLSDTARAVNVGSVFEENLPVDSLRQCGEDVYVQKTSTTSASE